MCIWLLICMVPCLNICHTALVSTPHLSPHPGHKKKSDLDFRYFVKILLLESSKLELLTYFKMYSIGCSTTCSTLCRWLLFVLYSSSFPRPPPATKKIIKRNVFFLMFFFFFLLVRFRFFDKIHLLETSNLE